MVLKAMFPRGVTELTLNGLHQWDYGQQLEIYADDLPAVFEVHFACLGMKEAEVRVCSMVEGVGVVTIPDTCLEQSAPIIAWIYEINGTTGMTTKAITLKVIPRAKPTHSDIVPTEVYDKYTEAITAMNTQVEALKSGEVIIGKALEADHSTSSDHATTASEAEIALRAEQALEAKMWSAFSQGGYWTSYQKGEEIEGGAFLINYRLSDGTPNITFLDTDNCDTAYSGVIGGPHGGESLRRIKASCSIMSGGSKLYVMSVQDLTVTDGDKWGDISNDSFVYKRLRTD